MTKTIFVAGATGAIGIRLLPQLVALGHRVYGVTRSASKAQSLLFLGVEPVVVDVFNADALTAAMRAAKPDIVIHQLTDLPRGLDPSQMEEGVRRNARIRAEGTANLVSAAQAAGAGLLVAQSIAWAYAAGNEPYTEESPLDIHAQGLRAISVGGVVALEKAVLEASGLIGMVLRYGQLYGPGTGEEIKGDKKLPLNVDGAAAAVLLAMHAKRPGVYNIVETNATVDTSKAQRELGWQPDLQADWW
ncbi:NAD(P)-dependent oxidoreductase [Herbaspirillum rubrisubalbicans Os34]|uniref:NAD(P)-dependent oxidoreductase n=1 Tax=Herbaspirillum rubrisubalbicans Os34 TaxID=1235827 RepID=A0A6M3ZUY6_9BURK|nr:NAD(P)-dependent oxidoreductase [Herbaspirillum rubrisubalbicans]QJQ02455.1 NAD(P)-dependent oxidoreductase [Herbaspirillum rubrisubalbicans Os34]